jgi:hypothetical protein
MSLDNGDLEQIERLVRAAVRDELESLLGDSPPLAKKWIGGKIEIWPREAGLEAKEIPLEVFFHKIVLLRDRLRVLEQQLNAHAKLDDDDKVHLQQYITRCYGSLTTFNILFKDKADHFSGSSGKGD